MYLEYVCVGNWQEARRVVGPILTCLCTIFTDGLIGIAVMMFLYGENLAKTKDFLPHTYPDLDPSERKVNDVGLEN